MKITAKASALSLAFGLIAGSAFTSEPFPGNHLQQNRFSTFCESVVERLAESIVAFNKSIKFVSEATAAGKINWALSGSVKATLILKDQILPHYEAHIGLCNYNGEK